MQELFGILFATFLLSLKTGLIIGSTNYKWIKKILIAYFWGLMFLVAAFLLKPYELILVKILDEYTFMASMIMALILIYLGLTETEEIKEDIKSSEYNKKGIIGKKLFAFLPCPFCLMALVIMVLYFGENIVLSVNGMIFLISGVFFIMQVLVALFTERMVRVFKIAPDKILNPLLMVIGIFTLVAGLFIPNFVQAMKSNFEPLILDCRYLRAVGVFTVVFFLLGYTGEIINKKRRSIN